MSSVLFGLVFAVVCISCVCCSQ